MNSGAPQLEWPLLGSAELRVQKIQAKLHRWATDDPDRRFHDVFNLVHDPAFLLVAWQRVRGNRGARSAGVDGHTAFFIEARRGVEPFLAEIRDQLKTQQFRPLPVRERMIPKPGGKRRRLGIATVRDRVVQAALKLVLEPIFEADFLPCSYGFRPRRRAHDAVAEVRTFAGPPHRYEWVLEGDITACFDEIDHTALMGLVRRRITDKRVLALVKAFLKAGIFSKETGLRESREGAPQGGILSPLLSNIALSVLDEHFDRITRHRRSLPRSQQRALPVFRLSRYADDWVLLVKGERVDVEALRDEAAAVLATVGLRLSQAKTVITHIDEGLDFLGWRIQRHRKPGTAKSYVYTYPSKKAVKAVTGKVRTLSRLNRNQPLEVLLHNLNPVLRGWCTYFQPGVSSATFAYLRGFTWRRVMGWLRRKHPGMTWKQLRRRYCQGGWWPSDGDVVLFNPTRTRTTRYRYRGAAIPTPWASAN
ncbi:group II intron reverse transcriptase/maturase [Micromonospora sp. 4G57]|uniref:Group II intron reverse transcriptase/maturase n=1 Tax=Micromonospora sicca TaxID=2202420 RepID=A0ABU5JPN1_9ACTN|nr:MULTISPECIES: group II intron reverse transcriptase/maturase [unclassified Micromonospora]MDZ5447826.1 group II intron reverse transcriptase/maturase [Micromonospora sp. 4G57]MDZ5494561.1 group II intron reverse transcriptase/maturase [Micromonospora sp. 4G53]